MHLVYNKPVYAFDFYTKENSIIRMPDRKSKIKRRTLYWICQTVGWLFYTLIILLLFPGNELNQYAKVALPVSAGILGLLSTHTIRNIIRKNNWVNLPLKKIIPRIITSGLTAGILISLISFTIYIFIVQGNPERTNLSNSVIEFATACSAVILWIIIYFSVHYFENYKRVEIESLIWEAAVKDFELKTLKSQLNPHFIFNALNSIRALINEDPANAQEAITSLSNILRYSLRLEQNETVPLEEEMKAVSDYLALESIRFEERLNYEIKIDQKSLKIGIPPMMIQTLVENGIKHGISKRTRGGSIKICSFVEDSVLHIKITNNGFIGDDALKKSGGFGINNTKHRLNLLFGEAASFSIKNSSPDEVTAEIIIPSSKKSNQQED